MVRIPYDVSAAEPDSEPDDTLLDDLIAFIRHYVVMTDAQLLAVSLWVIHTHCVEFVDTTPYVAVTSPEKQCGKTRLRFALSRR